MLTELDQRIIDRLKKKIVVDESKNLRTKNKSDAEMVKGIKKMIEEEVQCYSNQ